MTPNDPSVTSPFDDGDLYDVALGRLDYGLEFYVDLARQSGGPVLDIACGTGRIMLPSLQAGIDIEGLDLYASMLDRLRRKASALGINPRLHQADMSDFRLDRCFALVMIPFNTFVLNMTAEAQIRCLQLCREHLSPGGLLVFDTFFPASSLIAAPDGNRVLQLESAHPLAGLPTRVYNTRSFDRVAQIQRSHVEIEILNSGGEITVSHAYDISLRWIYKSEMELLIRLAGFSRWQICGDFDRRSLEHETDAMIVLAWNE